MSRRPGPGPGGEWLPDNLEAMDARVSDLTTRLRALGDDIRKNPIRAVVAGKKLQERADELMTKAVEADEKARASSAEVGRRREQQAAWGAMVDFHHPLGDPRLSLSPEPRETSGFVPGRTPSGGKNVATGLSRPGDVPENRRPVDSGSSQLAGRGEKPNAATQRVTFPHSLISDFFDSITTYAAAASQRESLRQNESSCPGTRREEVEQVFESSGSSSNFFAKAGPGFTGPAFQLYLRIQPAF
ncbi:hypothetical protein B0H11DRAFT_2299859 [Mycena galericulata]|nr:hypothetical protein B0H11DRAFT_2299859 [Mycena galericulata]